MAWFNVFKSYEHEINEIRRYLDQEKKMRAEYSGPFIAAYGRKMGILIESGRKKAVSFNTSNAEGAQANQIFAENGVRFAVLGQAIRAYMTDLRSGSHVKTAVETAIWGIILDEERELVDSIKPGLSNFVVKNFARMAPSARFVFANDQPKPLNTASGKKKSKLSEKSNFKISPSGSDQKKVFAALISLLGEEDTYRILELLSCNKLVVKSLGRSILHMNLNSRLTVTLGWLTNVFDDESIWEGMLSGLNRPETDFDSRKSSDGKRSLSVSDVSDLIKDLKIYSKSDVELPSQKKSGYLDFIRPGSKHNLDISSQSEEEITSNYQDPVNYMREIDINLNAILSQALNNQDSFYVELISIALWSSNARGCGVRAGIKLGLPPRDAATLIALIVGQTYEQVHKEGLVTEEIKEIYEHHRKVAIFLNKDVQRLRNTSNPVEFLKIFMEDFDITTLYSNR